MSYVLLCILANPCNRLAIDRSLQRDISNKAGARALEFHLHVRLIAAQHQQDAGSDNGTFWGHVCC
jgi:hypothetical protein